MSKLLTDTVVLCLRRKIDITPLAGSIIAYQKCAWRQLHFLLFRLLKSTMLKMTSNWPTNYDESQMQHNCCPLVTNRMVDTIKQCWSSCRLNFLRFPNKLNTHLATAAVFNNISLFRKCKKTWNTKMFQKKKIVAIYVFGSHCKPRKSILQHEAGDEPMLLRV